MVNRILRLTLFLLPLSLASAEESILSKVDSVLVYQDRALVSRVASVSFQAGKQTILWKGGPKNLDTESVRASLSNSHLVLESVRSWKERKLEYDNPEILQLEKREKDLIQTESELENEESRLQLTLSNLEAYNQYLMSKISEESVESGTERGESWKDAWTFLGKQKKSLNADRQNIQKDLKLIREGLAEVQNELQKRRSQLQKEFTVIEFHIQSPARIQSQLTFSYVVSGASWSVAYGMKLDARGRLGVEYYADVSQETGEDWQNVNLSLSTANPSLGAKRIQIRPLTVSARVVETQKEYQVVEKESAEKPDGFVGAAPPAESEDTGGYSSVDSSREASVFHLPKRVTVTSKEKSHRVTLAEFEEEPKKSYYESVSYLQMIPVHVLEIQNSRSFPLLAGPVDAYNLEGLLGRSGLDFTPPGSGVTLGFGTNRNLLVERSLHHFREKAGALSSDNEFHTQIDLQIQNKSNSSKELKLVERVPVSDVEEIKVEILDDSTKGYSEEIEGSGIIHWTFRLAPGEKRSIRLHYKVRAPSNFPGELFGK